MLLLYYSGTVKNLLRVLEEYGTEERFQDAKLKHQPIFLLDLSNQY